MIKTIPDRSLRALQIGKSIALVIPILILCFVSWIFVFFLMLVPFVLFYEVGVQLDFNNFLYRNYSKRIGKAKGEWKNLNEFNSVVLKRITGKRKMHDSVSGGHISFNDYIVDVYIMNHTHRKELFLRTYNYQDDALEFAHEIATLTAFPIKRYNPKRTSKRK